MKRWIYLSFIMFITLCACQQEKKNPDAFQYFDDKFADIEILHYQVPGFEDLDLRQKMLIYYLSEAALSGRDIIYDQNYRNNLLIRHVLENIYLHAEASLKNEADWEAFVVYLKRVWVSNGIHHHYATDKIMPGFSEAFFMKALKALPVDCLPTLSEEKKKELQHYAPDKTDWMSGLKEIIFNPNIAPKRVNQTDGEDLLLSSAENYYWNVSQKEAEAFYAAMADPNDPTPPSYGLNSRLIKKNGQLKEQVYKIGGMYSPALERVVYWLEKARLVAESEKQANYIGKLIDYYHSGDLRTFDEFSISWAQDLDCQVDFVNGFIENYGDPIGIKAAWEAIVNFKNIEASKRTETISQNAQWFEDHAPIAEAFKKKEVKGVSAKVINNALIAGDAYPTTAIGINLPNADWIRKEYGSKSVTIENISEAYNKASIGNGFSEEFMWSEQEIKASAQYGFLTGNLHTDLHECLGHGSGQLLPGTDPNALKAYSSTMEEARADLFALYFLGDEKLVELGLLPNKEAYKSEYYEYIMNGYMTQLTRIEEGNNIEEAHMRNRSLIAHWVMEHGQKDKILEAKKRDGKTYIVIHDYAKLRQLFGELLSEVQRIKSEGDYQAARKMVEDYAVKVDPVLHKEVLGRYATLNLSPYRGFVNPVYKPVYNEQQEVVDISISYDESYTDQHVRYSKNYAFLPL